MANNKYPIKYLPSFSDELNEIIYYITFILKNENAAKGLLKNVENAIKQKCENPTSFEVYKGKTNIKYNWYRIYIGNFTVFYTVRKNIIEITHIIYSARNFDSLI